METLTKLQVKEIRECLIDFGLNENEIQVYLTLLQSGSQTLTPIARQVHLPTTTIQSILMRLSEKGIIMSTKHKSRHKYEAYDPSILKTLLQRRIEEVSNILPLLRKVKKTEEVHLHPKVKVYYKDQVRDIFHEALECKGKLIYEIVSAERFQEVIGEKFHFTKRRIENGIHLKSLRVRAHEIKKYSRKTHINELREAKFLPHQLDFVGSIMFWDNSVALFTTKKEGISLVFESQVMRDTLKQLFDLLWSISGTMETKTEIG